MAIKTIIMCVSIADLKRIAPCSRHCDRDGIFWHSPTLCSFPLNAFRIYHTQKVRYGKIIDDFGFHVTTTTSLWTRSRSSSSSKRNSEYRLRAFSTYLLHDPLLIESTIIFTPITTQISQIPASMICQRLDIGNSSWACLRDGFDRNRGQRREPPLWEMESCRNTSV